MKALLPFKKRFLKLHYFAEQNIEDLQHFLSDSRSTFQNKFNSKFRNPIDCNLEDFERLRVLGAGSYGTVVAVYLRKLNKYYAMKILEKRGIIREKQVEHTYAEKRVLQASRFPFLVNLKFYFMDQAYLYFVMPLAKCGELYDILRLAGKFSEELARFYAAQVILGIEYLHHVDIVYRDLKPENLVVFSNGYLKITDFGFCKIVTGRTYTLCGTPEYLAPEVLKNKGYGKSVDWWAVGVLIYELNAGFSPFASSNISQTYEKILDGKLRFTKSMGSTLRSIVKQLVEKDLTRRLGNLRSGVADIKTHPWFEGFAWNRVLDQKMLAPSVPPIQSFGEGGVGKPYDPKAFAIRVTAERYSGIFNDF